MAKSPYKDTILLPKTSFSMKADLLAREPQIQKRWKQMDLYAKIREARAGREQFILHDGPPYPTGEMHVGLAMNKVLKDMVVRYKTRRGYDAPYLPGWDCHGLPIEFKVMQELREAGETPPKIDIRKRCKKYAETYVKKHKKQFIALGVSGEWDAPYLTFLPSYERGVLSAFAQMVGEGYVYRSTKPIHWCFDCETALAEAELEYNTKTSPSIYVNFALCSSVADLFPGLKPLHVMIWTTTPWTIPANLAIAVNERFTYTAVTYEKDGQSTSSIMAADTVEKVMAAIGATNFTVGPTATGKQLIGLRYDHPFMERTGPVVSAEYVSLEEGTGCVHTAPGHGADDYITGLNEGLEILSPLDSKGRYTDEFPSMQGVQVYDANDKLCDLMAEKGALAAKAAVSHSYPHCWRCNNPVIFRATEQWFVRVDHKDLRQRATEQIQDTRWIPGWGQSRITGMVADRPDWCISRQRSWGVPIPAFYCANCDRPLLTQKSVEAVNEIVGARGTNTWFELEPDEFLQGRFECDGCGGKTFRKEEDIFDVWFESGTSWRAVVQQNDHLRFPADLYLEGTDQHRGWFQLSLLPSVALEGVAPSKTVVTNGFIVDGSGQKMSKSKGNFISAEDVLGVVGADIFRLWVSSIDYKDHIFVDMAGIQEMATSYRRIRNTMRYLLGSLHDFDPKANAVPADRMLPIDRWAVAQGNELIRRVTQYNDDYDFHKTFQAIQNWCAVEMSSFYLDVLKDRMYTFAPDSNERRSGQTAQWLLLHAFVKLTAPVLVHTAEEVWQTMAEAGLLAKDEPAESVHLAAHPEPADVDAAPELLEKFGKLLAIREDVLREIEKLRADKTIGNALETHVTITSTDAEVLALLTDEQKNLASYFIVSDVQVAASADDSFVPGQAVPTLRIKVEKSAHPRCERCWNFRPAVGDHAEHPQLCDRCAAVVTGG